MPEPQQCGIQAVSATYTTSHSNAGSLLQGGQGSNPKLHGSYSDLLTTEPRQELQKLLVYIPFFWYLVFEILCAFCTECGIQFRLGTFQVACSHTGLTAPDYPVQGEKVLLVSASSPHSGWSLSRPCCSVRAAGLSCPCTSSLSPCVELLCAPENERQGSLSFNGESKHPTVQKIRK